MVVFLFLLLRRILLSLLLMVKLYSSVAVSILIIFMLCSVRGILFLLLRVV